MFKKLSGPYQLLKLGKYNLRLITTQGTIPLFIYQK